ncbi:MAG: hypothetical protein IJ803_03375 [Oribacterium sp.]|nr:hypothetical protein [Oribacterium sp.]
MPVRTDALLTLCRVMLTLAAEALAGNEVLVFVASVHSGVYLQRADDRMKDGGLL